MLEMPAHLYGDTRAPDCYPSFDFEKWNMAHDPGSLEYPYMVTMTQTALAWCNCKIKRINRVHSSNGVELIQGFFKALP